MFSRQLALLLCVISIHISVSALNEPSFQQCSCFEREWVKVGSMNNIPQIFKLYPVTQYDFGIIYNGPIVMKVSITEFNSGYGIMTINQYPAGDQSDQMRPIRCLWTKGIKDDINKKDNWLHQYINPDFKPFFSNGVMDLPLYARRM